MLFKQHSFQWMCVDSAGPQWGLGIICLKAPQGSALCRHTHSWKSWTPLSVVSSLGSFINGGFFVLFWPRIYFPMLQKRWNWTQWIRSCEQTLAILASLSIAPGRGWWRGGATPTVLGGGDGYSQPQPPSPATVTWSGQLEAWMRNCVHWGGGGEMPKLCLYP